MPNVETEIFIYASVKKKEKKDDKPNNVLGDRKL